MTKLSYEEWEERYPEKISEELMHDLKFYHKVEDPEAFIKELRIQGYNQYVNEFDKINNEWKSAAMKLGEKLSPNGPDDYYGFTADQWLQWSEESVKKLNTTKEDIDDIKAIALDIQQMAAKANYSDNTFAEFAYDIDQAMRAVLEIIEKPKYSIIKVISRDE